jgi:hypothetical protein
MPSRELIQQRLKQVVVRPVDDGDIDLGAPQRLRRKESAESAADDHDVMPAACCRSAHRITSELDVRRPPDLGGRSDDRYRQHRVDHCGCEL